MSSGLISFIFGLGVAGWVYSQAERRAGTSNLQVSASAAGIAFLVAFIFLFTLTKYVIHLN